MLTHSKAGIMKNLFQAVLLAASLLIASALPAKADGIINPGSSGGGGGVTPSGTFTAGDLIAGAGSTSVQDSANCTNTTCVSPSGINITKNIVMSGSQSSVSNPQSSTLYWAGTVGGTCTNSGAGCGVFEMFSSSFGVTGTNAGVSIGEMMHVQANITGSNQIFGTQVADFIAQFNGASGNAAGTNESYVALNAWSHSQANDNGSVGTANGGIFGAVVHGGLESGATFWHEVHGQEIDIYVNTGASTQIVDGLSVILSQSNAVAGTLENTGMFLGAQNGVTATLQCGYCFGSVQSFNPMAAGASLMAYIQNTGTPTTMAVTNGIHLNANVTFSGNAYDSPGFGVDGSGNITGLTLSPTGTGCTTNINLPSASTVGICAGTVQVATFTINSASLNTHSATGAVNTTVVNNTNAGAASTASVFFGNSTSATEVGMTLNGGSFSGGLGANAFAINAKAGMWLQGNGTSALVITATGVPQLPSVTTGTPTASLCLDASNNIVKKTTTGSCV